MSKPSLPFDQAESDKCHRAWGASCGPVALSAAAGCSITEAGKALPDFIYRKYTNPTMMEAALKTLDIHHVRTKGLHLKTPTGWGVSRLQFEGRWMDAGVHPAAAYAYTHWIASKAGYVLCTATWKECDWTDYELWKFEMDALCARQNYRGWHITHHYLFL